MKEEKKKILFIHNKAMWYRIPFFNELSKEYETNFIFTNETKVENLESRYQILRRYGVYPFSVAFGLIPQLIRENYDIVVFPPPDSPGELIDNIICVFIAKLTKKPYMIWSERWKWKHNERNIFKRFYHLAEGIVIRYLCKNARACVTSGGTKQKEYFLSFGVSTNKVFIIPYVSQNLSKNNSLETIERVKRTLNITNKKVILYVGRLIRRKGVNYLIHAFGKLRNERDDICLLIIGGKGYYGRTDKHSFTIEELKNLSKNCGLEIETDIYFLGDVPNENLPPYYQLCNVFVLPAVTFGIAEPWGLVLNEAMQFGKPVIATDAVGAAYDLIQNGINGFMIQQKDVDALYEAMKKILTDPELERKMGEASKRIIDGAFTYAHMVEGFDKAIESMGNSDDRAIGTN